MSANAFPGGGPVNAWEDDWENQADTLDDEQQPPPQEKKVSSKVTKAQRRAQQAEFNRQLWAEAESPQTFHFLEAQSNVPLKQDLQPAVTVLSRKPQPSRSTAAVNPPTAGMARLAVSAGDAVDDSEEDDEKQNKPPEPTPEERQAIALRNLEERQRKYEEVRERLFGTPSADASGNSSPRSATPPTRQQPDSRGKGKSRGGGGGGRENYKEKRDSSSTSSKSRQLYDPAGNPGKSSANYVQRKDSQSPNDRTGSAQSQAPRQPLRSPRGPDPSGRGGFKQGARGSKTA